MKGCLAMEKSRGGVVATLGVRDPKDRWGGGRGGGGKLKSWEGGKHGECLIVYWSRERYSVLFVDSSHIWARCLAVIACPLSQWWRGLDPQGMVYELRQQ